MSVAKTHPAREGRRKNIYRKKKTFMLLLPMLHHEMDTWTLRAMRKTDTQKLESFELWMHHGWIELRKPKEVLLTIKRRVYAI
nr:unnamed protein product [Callosobruchus analis]CAI5840657.1 unnamed protein product [Callosobruchus analis]